MLFKFKSRKKGRGKYNSRQMNQQFQNYNDWPQQLSENSSVCKQYVSQHVTINARSCSISQMVNFLLIYRNYFLLILLSSEASI